MRCFIATLLFLFASLISGHAQNCRILDNVIANMQSTQGVSMQYELQIDSELTKGKIDILGDKYILSMPDMTIWFDGKTQWTYIHSAQEVNINTPEPEEIAQTNPYQILQSYKNAYVCKQIGEKGDVYEFELTPKSESGINLIRVLIKKSTSALMQISITQDGITNTIKITDTISGNFSDNHFTFDKTKYPGTEIIDLR